HRESARHAAVRGAARRAHRGHREPRLSHRARRGPAARPDASLLLLRHRRRAPAPPRPHGRDRLWARRPLQHDARRARRRGGLPRHDRDLLARHPGDMPMRPRAISRRTFLRTTGALAGVMVAPGLAPPRALAQGEKYGGLLRVSVTFGLSTINPIM